MRDADDRRRDDHPGSRPCKVAPGSSCGGAEWGGRHLGCRIPPYDAWASIREVGQVAGEAAQARAEAVDPPSGTGRHESRLRALEARVQALEAKLSKVRSYPAGHGW